MDTQIWPFVVARNRTLDWRPVLAPDVLVDEGRDFRLVLETTGNHPIDITCRTWGESPSDAWSIAYRSVSAVRSFIGDRGDGQLLDRFGRPVYLIEGVATRGDSGLPATGCESLIDHVHLDALAAFAHFWSEEEENGPPQRSTPLTLDGSADAPNAEAAVQDPGALDTTPPHRVVATIAVALLVAIVLLAALVR